VGGWDGSGGWGVPGAVAWGVAVRSVRLVPAVGGPRQPVRSWPFRPVDWHLDGGAGVVVWGSGSDSDERDNGDGQSGRQAMRRTRLMWGAGVVAWRDP